MRGSLALHMSPCLLDLDGHFLHTHQRRFSRRLSRRLLRLELQHLHRTHTTNTYIRTSTHGAVSDAPQTDEAKRGALPYPCGQLPVLVLQPGEVGGVHGGAGHHARIGLCKPRQCPTQLVPTGACPLTSDPCPLSARGVKNKRVPTGTH
jgi:hypothetical protein